MAARPNRYVPGHPSRKRELLESFPAGPFMSAMDLIEDRHFTVEQALRAIGERTDRPVHDGIMQWTRHAVRGYVDRFGDNREQLLPLRGRWTHRTRLSVPDDRGARTYEINVWGRCYTSSDGETRELRLIANRRNTRVRAEAEIAVAAIVVARGKPGPTPKRIRIRQFGMLEGSVDPIFDGTVADAEDMYRRHGRKALGAIVDSQEYRPGATCADCQFAVVCPALSRAPGLLGIADRTRPRRSWSPTNARSYRACPARAHLRQHRLPVEAAVERSPAAERGRAVHASLERCHARGDNDPCASEVPANWAPPPFDLPESERELGRLLLRHHADVCPLRHATEVRTEPDLVYDDTDSDVVVLAKPDLLYQERGTWVWREVKTSASNRRRATDVLAEYPQLALGVLLLARGALGGGRGRVELEVLRPGGADLTMLDPFTVGVRERAKRVLLEHVRAWHADDHFTAVPGAECGRCEVSRWCSARVAIGA
ncbi:hypothetical protein Ate01nite_25090 [Actinoplanes teichomyceticus]|nr:hypothetical protein Ate01nite_25090 [Actinoplanes teichomyceticus]